MKVLENATNQPEVAFDADDSSWQQAFAGRGGEHGHNAARTAQRTVYRADFDAPQSTANDDMTLALRSLGNDESIYLNGEPLAQNVAGADGSHEIFLPEDRLRGGKNVIAVVATPKSEHATSGGDNANPGNPGLIKVTYAAGQWKRSLFSGLAQIIVQSTGQPGEITLTAKSAGLTDSVLKVTAEPAMMRPAIP